MRAQAEELIKLRATTKVSFDQGSLWAHGTFQACNTPLAWIMALQMALALPTMPHRQFATC